MVWRTKDHNLLCRQRIESALSINGSKIRRKGRRLYARGGTTHKVRLKNSMSQSSNRVIWKWNTYLERPELYKWTTTIMHIWNWMTVQIPKTRTFQNFAETILYISAGTFLISEGVTQLQSLKARQLFMVALQRNTLTNFDWSEAVLWRCSQP